MKFCRLQIFHSSQFILYFTNKLSKIPKSTTTIMISKRKQMLLFSHMKIETMTEGTRAVAIEHTPGFLLIFYSISNLSLLVFLEIIILSVNNCLILIKESITYTIKKCNEEVKNYQVIFA